MKSVLVLVLGLVLFSGCAGVTRVDTDKVVDLSGKWNDTDSRFVAEAMIEDCLKRPWLEKFEGKNKRAPVVIVGTVRNKSHEHISVQTFVKDLERSLLNSGAVEFVASRAERDEIRGERKDQASNSSEDTAKEAGEETGADFMLKGVLNTILDKIEGKAVMFYQVNMELINIQSNKKVWIGEKKIKKIIKGQRVGF